MFPSGPACEAAYPWGYLTDLWHDLGKFAPEWQTYLASKADPHSAESTGSPSKKEDHSTAGAVFSNGLPPFGPLHCEEAFAILDHPENDYHPQTGLKRPGAASDPNAFCL